MDVKMRIKLEDLVKTGSHWLELFDSSLAQDNIPLLARPLQSAMWLVRDGIEKLPFGDSKEEFFDKEWFAALVIAVREWYQDRYGAATFEPVHDTLSGVVLMHGTPVKIEARVTVAKVEVEGETSWIIFPDAIHESESLKSFFPTRPNLNALSTNDRAELEKRVASIVRSDFITVAALLNDTIEVIMKNYAHLKKATSFERYEGYVKKMMSNGWTL